MKANTMRSTSRQIGTRSSINGGGGNGGSTSGKISNDAVRQTSSNKDSNVKYRNIILLCSFDNDWKLSDFLNSTKWVPLLLRILGCFAVLTSMMLFMHWTCRLIKPFRNARLDLTLDGLISRIFLQSCSTTPRINQTNRSFAFTERNPLSRSKILSCKGL